jgi:hypothetical protein
MSGPWGQDWGTGGPRNSEAMFGSKDSHIGGDAKSGAWARSPLAKFKDDNRATSRDTVDIRNDIDVSMEVLERKYANEFSVAEKRITERQQHWSEKMRNKFGYDLEADRAYNFWQEEEADRREFLHIHPIDVWLDDPRMQVQYGMRLFTTIGLMHGVWKTRMLWRSIDRNYAKLHGVGLGSIAAEHISWAVLKGAGVGVAWGVGTLSGDQLSRVGECLITDSVHRPMRKWQHVTSACVAGGIAATVASVGVNWKTLKPFGHSLVAGTIMVSASAMGVYLGPYVYKRYRLQYPQPYDETPRPWHEKEFQKVGPAGIRGRWA